MTQLPKNTTKSDAAMSSTSAILDGSFFAPLPLRKAYLKSFERKERTEEESSGNGSANPSEATVVSTALPQTCTHAKNGQHALERFVIDPRLIEEAREYINAVEDREFKRRHVLPPKTQCGLSCCPGEELEAMATTCSGKVLSTELDIEAMLQECGISIRGNTNQTALSDGSTVVLSASSLMSCDSCPSQTKSCPSVSLHGLKSLLQRCFLKVMKSAKKIEDAKEVTAMTPPQGNVSSSDSNLGTCSDDHAEPRDVLVASLQGMLTTSMDDMETSRGSWGWSGDSSHSWWDESFRQMSFLRRLLCPITVDCHKCGTTFQLFETFANLRKCSRGSNGTTDTNNDSRSSHCESSLQGVSLIHVLAGVPEFLPSILVSLERALYKSTKYMSRCESPVSVHQCSSMHSPSPEMGVYHMIVSHLESLKHIKMPASSQAHLRKILDHTSFPELIAQPEISIRKSSLRRMHEFELKNDDVHSKKCADKDGSDAHRLSNVGGALDHKAILRRGMKRILDDVLNQANAGSPPLKKQALGGEKPTSGLVSLTAGNKEDRKEDSPKLDRMTTLQGYIQHKKDMLLRIQKLKKAAAASCDLLSSKEIVGIDTEPQIRAPKRPAKAVSQERATSNDEQFLDSSDISAEDFVATTYYLNDLYELFQKRSVIPGKEPRMPLKHIHVTDDAQKRLCDILFQTDGSLRPDILSDIDVSTENDPRFINFGNNDRTGRQDLRFQVGLRKQIHAYGAPIPTREKINEIFVELGVIDPEHESLHEIGILIGGTEDQSLHHDCARRFVKWYPEPMTGKESQKEVASMEGVLDGFEIDVLRYNTVMSSPHAPSSLLVGLGPSGDMLVGVQKDRILRETLGSKWCVIEGTDDVKYEIVRETDTLAVLRVSGGVIFTGDFPHCGVRNFHRGTPDEELVKALNQKIHTITKEYSSRQRISRSKTVVDMLGQFPGLNRLCRLHCSTQTHDCSISIPFNMIGYAECFTNKRDDRCLDTESNECEMSSSADRP